MASNLDNNQKRSIIGALLSGDTWEPAHDTALAWNRKVLQDTAGKSAAGGVPTKSQGSIHDAWVKLLYLHPTTSEQDTLYHNGEGTALLSHYYNIVPYTGKIWGDCRTDYRPQPTRAALRLLVNGVSQGEGSEVAYKVNGDATLTAQLDVSQTTYVDRYKWNSYCCQVSWFCTKWGCFPVCTSWCGTCDLKSTETRNSHVRIEDSLEAKLYSYTPKASFTPIEQYGDTVRADFIPDPGANTYLKIDDDKVIHSQTTVYWTEVSEPPFDTLTVTAEPSASPEEQTEIESETLLLHKTSECELGVIDYFGNKEFPCSTGYTGPRLGLTTDRLYYYAGNPIQLKIKGIDGEAEIGYAGEFYNAADELSLTAKPHFTRITGAVSGQEASVNIAVINTNMWLLLWRILILLLIAAGTISFIQNWARRRNLWDAA